MEEEVRRLKIGLMWMKSVVDDLAEYFVDLAVECLLSERRRALCPAATTSVRVAVGGDAIKVRVVAAPPKLRFELRRVDDDTVEAAAEPRY